jgi:hypothetical protein
MKQLWCWRCKIEIPMLDESEFEHIANVYRHCIQTIQQEREERRSLLQHVDLESGFAPFLEAYFAQTGFQETNPNAILHHRLALYGPACHACGKPLRTPAASICAACGTPAPHPANG